MRFLFFKAYFWQRRFGWSLFFFVDCVGLFCFVANNKISINGFHSRQPESDLKLSPNWKNGIDIVPWTVIDADGIAVALEADDG